MQYNLSILTILWIFFTICESKDMLLSFRNNFLRLYLNTENLRIKKMLNCLSESILKLHYLSIENCYYLSYKYYTLTEEEKNILDVIAFFV